MQLFFSGRQDIILAEEIGDNVGDIFCGTTCRAPPPLIFRPKMEACRSPCPSYRGYSFNNFWDKNENGTFADDSMALALLRRHILWI
jgi:hypothetical protein